MMHLSAPAFLQSLALQVPSFVLFDRAGLAVSASRYLLWFPAVCGFLMRAWFLPAHVVGLLLVRVSEPLPVLLLMAW